MKNFRVISVRFKVIQMKWLNTVTFAFIMGIVPVLDAQPVRQTKMMIEELEIYGDYKSDNQFYYAPGGLSMVKDSEGKPDFKLIQMRYTGTMATGNQGEVRFMNIVQFKVAMEHNSKAELDALKVKLGRQATISPLPLHNIEAYLVAPFEGKYVRIGNSGSLQAQGSSGNTSTSSFWTERTYTLRLDNHEAQLLWDMVENGNIALSVAYSYYADMIGEFDSEAHVGGRNSLESIDMALEEITKADSVPSLQLVRAEAFNIHVDVQKYPDVLVKNDLNEGVPPSYPALEVMCFDFTEDLRPDLAMKTIEFEAVGVDGSLVQLRSEKFFDNNPDQHTRQIRFPYAVNMRKAFRYRVKEYSKDGEQTDSGWITKESWTGGLDITSRAENIQFHKRTIEIEFDPASLSDEEVESLAVLIEYTYQKTLRSDRIIFTDASLPIAIRTVLCDKNSVISYKPEWVYVSGEKVAGLKNTFTTDNYAYILPMEQD